MADVLKISAVLVLIVVLTKRRWNLGGIMLLSTMMIALLYRMPPYDVARNLYVTAVDWTTIELVLILTLIRGFEFILRKRGLLSDMMDTLKRLLRGHTAVIAAMPALIGMLPSVGGALFSAPMVQETTKNLHVSAAKKSFINYWFRHPWEYILPLYPGIVLASGLTGIPLRKMIGVNLPLAAAMVVAGIFLGLRGIRMKRVADHRHTARGIMSFLPILTLLLFVLALRLGLLQALVLELVFVFIFLRSPLSEIMETLKKSVSLEIIVLIYGILLFKTTMETSGGIHNMSVFFSDNKIPLMPLLFFLPFITGVLTGFTVGFVGSTFPLLLSLVHNDLVRHMGFAFCSGYVGVLLSPVHLCLVLTRQYFDADLWRIYRRILPASLFTFSVGTIVYLLT